LAKNLLCVEDVYLVEISVKLEAVALVPRAVENLHRILAQLRFDVKPFGIIVYVIEVLGPLVYIEFGEGVNANTQIKGPRKVLMLGGYKL
jgi:hypothetical protein